MTPYQHGGDITAFAKRCGCMPEEVIDLSSNINFVKPHIQTDFNGIDIASYPNDNMLQSTIASHYGVAHDELALFNGASAAIYALLGYLRHHTTEAPSHIVLYDPLYLEYKKAAKIFGFETIHINRYQDLDMPLPKNALVIFVNPATPDGISYTMEPLLAKWMEKGCRILIDESFLEFTKTPSVSNHIKNYDKLWILKSMTKFFGAAGVRVGALLSNTHNITSLSSTLPPWRISAFDAAYIIAALQDADFAKRSDHANAKAKEALVALLDNAPLVAHRYEGDANFVLAKLHIRADKLQEALVPHRTLVRDCSNFDGLSGYHVRIAVKAPHTLTGLKKVLHG